MPVRVLTRKIKLAYIFMNESQALLKKT